MHWATLTQVMRKGLTHLHFPVTARCFDVVPDSYELYFNDSSNVLHFTSRTFTLTPESLLSKAGHIICILCASKLMTSSACMSVFCYYSSIVYTETDAFPSCCPVLWDLLNNSGVSDETSYRRTIWTAVSTTLSVSHLKSPGCRQRPDLTDSILTNRDLRYTCDAQTLIKRTEQANKHQKGTRRLKK